MSELIQNYLDKRVSMADVARPKKPEKKPVGVLELNEEYLIYAKELQKMPVVMEVDYGGEIEGELFTFAPIKLS